MKQFLLAVVCLVALAGCCAPGFGDPTMQVFDGMQRNTGAVEQNYRVKWKAKIKANLKDGADKANIEQYLDTHGSSLAGIAATSKNLNTAAKAQKK